MRDLKAQACEMLDVIIEIRPDRCNQTESRAMTAFAMRLQPLAISFKRPVRNPDRKQKQLWQPNDPRRVRLL